MATKKTSKQRRVSRTRSGTRIASADRTHAEGPSSQKAPGETITEVSVRRPNQRVASICHSRKDEEGDEWIACGSCCIGPIKPLIGFTCAVCDAAVTSFRQIPYSAGGYL